ncbi:MAG TPA: N-acetylmuramoyl-L-alanine amidase, partial [Acidimicrobiales bacterium]|nr:N-acetylmuramoyl-L-alanine amidase [Acidimicrobiales bacterium]
MADNSARAGPPQGVYRRRRAVLVAAVAIALVVASVIALNTKHPEVASDPDPVGGSAGTYPGTGSGAGPAPKNAIALDSSYFAKGSCVLYRPTAGDRHEVVFLDAGHGGLDPGAVGSTESGRTIYESTETLAVELDALSVLRANGFTVVVSRTTNSTVLKLQPADIAGKELSLVGAH